MIRLMSGPSVIPERHSLMTYAYQGECVIGPELLGEMSEL